MGVITVADELALSMLCETYAEYLEAKQALAEYGMTYEATGGLIKRNPAAAIVSDCDRRIRAWLIEFAMTPASRSRVTARDVKEEDDFATADQYFS